MADNNTYLQFIREVKQQILESRYQAAKLVNKELLVLYYNIGKMLREKIKQAKWGDKVLQNISADLQNELPGLRATVLSACLNDVLAPKLTLVPVPEISTVDGTPTPDAGNGNHHLCVKMVGVGRWSPDTGSDRSAPLPSRPYRPEA